MLLQFNELYQAACEGRPVAMTVEAEGTTYVRNFRPQERLILLGGGHITQPLCGYGADLGFAVTVVDDRPSFANQGRFPDAREVIYNAFPEALRSLKVHEQNYVAVITRGHRYNADCLRTILSGIFPKHLGMIGSTPVKSGAIMAVDRSLKTVGTIGGGCGEHAVLMEAHRLIGTDQCRCIQVDMSNDVAEDEGMVCGGQMKVLVQGIGG